MPAWLEKHNPQKLAGQISGFMSAYRSSIQMHSTESLHVLGHCFGGKYALWQAKEDFVTSALAVHPVFPSLTSVCQIRYLTWMTSLSLINPARKT